MDLGDHLFRHEYGKMVSALTRSFGIHNLALAEDVVQDAFCRALDVWGFKGVPDNPAAWLMTTAKNRALDIVRRQSTAKAFAPQLAWHIENQAADIEACFTAGAIQDEQLRMMFACCQPNLSEKVQIALMLNILCGFSAQEIASAFMESFSAAEKRLVRGKRALAAAPGLFDEKERLSENLPAIQRGLYVLFNEGYHSSSPDAVIRSELCQEAIRLLDLLLQHPEGATPASFALGALMRLHASRLPARTDLAGHPNALCRQDRTLWDRRLQDEGLAMMHLSASGSELSEYHIESAIAAIHAAANSVEDTDWGTIVSLYDALLALHRSPIIGLNRAIAVAQFAGAGRGIEAIEAIPDKALLANYPFYHAALGELELRLGKVAAATEKFAAACRAARNASEREFFADRIRAAAGEGEG